MHKHLLRVCEFLGAKMIAWQLKNAKITLSGGVCHSELCYPSK